MSTTTTSEPTPSPATPMPSQVVVGFDFSQSSQIALERALTLAARAPWHVLHVVCVIGPHAPIRAVPSESGRVDYAYAEQVQAAITAEVERRLGATDVPQRIHFAVHTLIGDASREILAVAKNVGADLILVGSKPMSGLTRLVLGSVSEAVACAAGCTVEIVRPRTYAAVTLEAVTTVEPHHTYVPPHRYSYQQRQLNLRPDEWPLP